MTAVLSSLSLEEESELDSAFLAAGVTTLAGTAFIAGFLFLS